MSADFRWVSVTTSRDAAFMVKNTEIANTIVPDTLCRFQICEHRAYDADMTPNVIYRVRDAETVTDSEVSDGVRPRIVRSFTDFDEAVSWCQNQHKSAFEAVADAVFSHMPIDRDEAERLAKNAIRSNKMHHRS